MNLTYGMPTPQDMVSVCFGQQSELAQSLQLIPACNFKNNEVTMLPKIPKVWNITTRGEFERALKATSNYRQKCVYFRLNFSID